MRGSVNVPGPSYPEFKKLRDAAVLHTAQTLTDEQKAQARANIGAIKSWGEMEGKPVTREALGDTLTWDGNTEGLEYNETLGLYRIADSAPTIDDLNNADNMSGGIGFIGSDSVQEFAHADIFYEEAAGAVRLVALGGLTAFLFPEDFDAEGLVAQKGVYTTVFDEDGDAIYLKSLTIPGYTFTKEVISPDHIPEHSHDVSWPEVTGKPFVTVGGDTLTWDGNTEGLVSVDLTAINGNAYYKVSDAVPTSADFASGATFETNGGSATLAGNAIIEAYDGILTGEAVMFIVVAEKAVGVDYDGAVFPEAGVYFGVSSAYGYICLSLTIPGYTGFTKEQIDPAVLPESDVVVVNQDLNTYKLDKTLAEIKALQDAGKFVMCAQSGTPISLATDSAGTLTASIERLIYTGNTVTSSGEVTEVALMCAIYAFDADGNCTGMGLVSIPATLVYWQSMG